MMDQDKRFSSEAHHDSADDLLAELLGDDWLAENTPSSVETQSLEEQVTAIKDDNNRVDEIPITNLGAVPAMPEEGVTQPTVASITTVETWDDDAALAAVFDDFLLEDEEAVAEATEEHHLLDDLIASIDNEIDALYGADQMVELGESTSTTVGEEQHVVFELAGTTYTVPISSVSEVGRQLEITLIPNVPQWVLGVANLRGDIISVVDLRRFFGFEPQLESEGRLMVAQSSNEEMSIGLVVDRVNGISRLSGKGIAAPTAPIADEIAPYLRGVYEQDRQLLVVLDLDRLLMANEMQQFQPT